jgi:hypothetical protein
VREPTRYETWHGRDEPPATLRELCAGPLTVQLEGIDLRYVRVGDVELVRRLFAAVRDSSWGTVPPQVGEVEVEDGGDSFRVSFEALHERGDLRFRWRGSYEGTSEGKLECRFDGVADSDFQYNRIGFCVLHPRENAGCAYRAHTPDGELVGALPGLIGPQRVEDGKLWPLFPSYTRLEIEVAGGVWARFDFTGDLFEMEDQRNWTDASFKTYSTPLSLGWPYDAKTGGELVQSVTLSVEGEPPARDTGDGVVRIEVGEPAALKLPKIGLGLSSDGRAPTDRETELLVALRPDHLRVDLHLSDEGWQDELERAGDTALALGTALELAVFLGEGPEAGLEELAAALPLAQARVARVLVFGEGDTVTPASLVRLARDKLADAVKDAPFYGGTDIWFTDINRTPPEVDGLDGVAYSVTATVHADDDVSVRETPAAQADTVVSARALAPGKEIAVGPVTIRPRSWPHGVLEGVAGLPFQVDPRQCALFGAAWTAASLKHLCEIGADVITYFETTGWRGVIESDEERPAGFPSRPGAAFPLYHVLADLGDWKDSRVLGATSSEPLAVEALCAHDDAGWHLLVANLTPEPRRCAVGTLPVGQVSVRMLDEAGARRAGEDPEGYRGSAERRDAPGGRLELELGPYAVARVDA